MKTNHDQLFKELLTTFFVEFLDLFFPAIVEYFDPDSISFVDKELFANITSGRKKILDIVALAKFKGEDSTFLIHVENESSSKSDFNRRFFKYFCTLFLKYNAPIYPIVVFFMILL
ncbi:Putative transposase, YhgA [Xenococcus sp. PCC 7305]|uniref:transposase n=1 Tax=Xenococcus sp. PCC 7305 TaxID=102125 RepID=UPI0002ABC2B2|nr:transposase [Xenococcus sp. PCC 7305]ELS02180.1 Putative transposase, YhgA [Xenococcus sp. PCC 7305]